MNVVYERLQFDWGKGNTTKNWLKHGVDYLEIEEVFFNDPLVAGLDKRHSCFERRYYCLGETDLGRYLFVCYTIRKNNIRPILARPISKKERKVYEKAKENSAF